MIGYVTLGIIQYVDAARFYDELLAVTGASRIREAS